MLPTLLHRIGAALVITLVITAAADAVHTRSSNAVAQFKREHPCPSNEHRQGPCPGYVVDHMIPLCAGGPDVANNMQWQSVTAAKEKDRWERAICALHSPSLTP